MINDLLLWSWNILQKTPEKYKITEVRLDFSLNNF